MNLGWVGGGIALEGDKISQVIFFCKKIPNDQN